MGRDRNERGRYADRIDPDTVMDVFAAREDAARPVTASDVVEELGIARRTAHNKLNALVERGTLDTRKVGARGRVWWIPDRRETPATDARADAVDDATDGPADPPADAHGADADPEEDALDAVLADLPSTVDDRDAARETILAAREYLRTDGPAPEGGDVPIDDMPGAMDDPTTTLADESDDTDARADAVDDATDGPADPPADAHGADAAPEKDALDAVLADLPGTVDPDAARETILAAREYLRTHGPAPKAAIVRNVMPDHPLGYDLDAALAKIEAGDRYRGAWWRRVVKPGLEALDDVTKPPKGASDWKAAEGST